MKKLRMRGRRIAALLALTSLMLVAMFPLAAAADSGTTSNNPVEVMYTFYFDLENSADALTGKVDAPSTGGSFNVEIGGQKFHLSCSPSDGEYIGYPQMIGTTVTAGGQQRTIVAAYIVRLNSSGEVVNTCGERLTTTPGPDPDPVTTPTTITTIPQPDPDPEPEFFFAFTKVWDLPTDFADFGDADDLSVTIGFDGEVLEEGEEFPVELDTLYDVGAETVTGLPVDCEVVASDLPEDYTTPTEGEDGDVFSLTVTNEVECSADLLVETSVLVDVTKVWSDGVSDLRVPPAFSPEFIVTILDGDGTEIASDQGVAGEFQFTGLIIDEEYTVTWSEVVTEDLAEFTRGRTTCTWSEDDSMISGMETFTAGVDEALSFTATNAYDCATDLGETHKLPETGVSALLLSLMGLLGMGLGGGMLATRKRNEQ